MRFYRKRIGPSGTFTLLNRGLLNRGFTVYEPLLCQLQSVARAVVEFTAEWFNTYPPTIQYKNDTARKYIYYKLHCSALEGLQVSISSIINLVAGLFDAYPKASSTKMIAGLFDAYSKLELISPPV